MKLGENPKMPYPQCGRSIKTYPQTTMMPPSTTKYGSLVRPHAQIVALRVHSTKCTPHHHHHKRYYFQQVSSDPSSEHSQKSMISSTEGGFHLSPLVHCRVQGDPIEPLLSNHKMELLGIHPVKKILCTAKAK